MINEIFKSFFHPSEIGAMFRLKFGGRIRAESKLPLLTLAKQLNDLDFCYAVLNKVSRSFAVVIQQLPDELKDAVCIFYLVLRGLDSVEDDMTFDNKHKIPLLKSFHTKLNDPNWKIDDVGDSPDYRILMAHFHKVTRVYQTLKKDYQAAITDITYKMGHGMAEFIEKKVDSIETVEKYNLYCHYVAGLVGYGLSALFSSSGLESPDLRTQQKISNSMGLFLQKTNIIRDYLEDIEQGRKWWPREIWKNYSSSLDELKEKPTSEKSLACLNHMVADALAHVPDCLDYLARLKNRKIFEFCAIPQVMAIATLVEVYNNPKVYTGVVKIRKGLSCKLMLNSSDSVQVARWFYTFAEQIRAKIPKDKSINDPSIPKITQYCDQINTLTSTYTSSNINSSLQSLRLCNYIAWIVFIISTLYLLSSNSSQRIVGTLIDATQKSSLHYAAIACCLTSLAYLFGFFGISYV